MKLYENKNLLSPQRQGVALIFTVIVLVLLTALVYRISSSVSQWKHRMQYMIDYQTARYACESGLKYAISSISDVNVEYISRPNEPDFSDLFTMSDEEFKLMMMEWAEKMSLPIDVNNLSKGDFFTKFMDLSRSDSNDSNDSNSTFEDSSQSEDSSYDYDTKDFNDTNDSNSIGGWDPNEPNEIYVRGPYGPPWPYITKPSEIEFGDARVTIEVIDENAKLPLLWGLCTDANAKNETKAAVETFCEWMQMTPGEIDTVVKELEDLQEIKPFSTTQKPIVTTTTESGDSNTAAGTQTPGRTSRRTSRIRQRRAKQKAVQQSRTEISQTLDFARILHSPMINLETLAKPVNKDENRSESALKYISLWGTQKVNINTAPRQVLEAAFTFGGDASEIAQAIIDERRVKPFSSIDDITKRIVSFSDSIKKAGPYITTQSDCFSIRVIATSGVAKVCATAAIKKEKEKVQQIGIIIE